MTLSVTGPLGFFPTFTAPAMEGVASFNLNGVLYAPAGSYTITASSGTLASATGSFTVSPAAAAQASLLAEAGLPATVTQGSNLGSAVAISIETNAGTVVSTAMLVLAALLLPFGSRRMRKAALIGISGCASSGVYGPDIHIQGQPQGCEGDESQAVTSVVGRALG